MGSPHKHVWTYVAGCSDSKHHIASNCSCAAVSGRAPPAFVGEHYYCEAHDNGQEAKNNFYTDDPLLWDSAGCVHANNTCCNIVGLPWFF